MNKKGILLVNLGSPKSTKVEDVKEYLDEFLMDERVIDYRWFFRALLVRGIILKTRPAKSAEAYKTVWTDQGSPLIVITEKIQKKLQKLVDIPVEIGMRYAEPSIENGIKKLVEQGIVDGWDDPRLVTIAALRRRGFTPQSLRMFVEMCGISKSQSSAEYAMLEYCIREDLKLKVKRMMAVLDPIRLVIDNYPENQIEMLEIENNKEVPEMGMRQIPFGKELYIEREDFMEEPPKKYFRLFPGNEVRLMNAYFVKCTGCIKDADGNVTEVHCTYDPETKSGSGFEGRKVKGTIHWVAAAKAVNAEVRLYENIIDEEKGVYNEDGSLNLNPDSIKIIPNAKLEPELAAAKAEDKFQFVRNGYFCADSKDTSEQKPVFNRIVSLKSSFVLPKKD